MAVPDVLTLISGLGVITQDAKTPRMLIPNKNLNERIIIAGSSKLIIMLTQRMAVVQYFTIERRSVNKYLIRLEASGGTR
jgi:hypothetical protein